MGGRERSNDYSYFIVFYSSLELRYPLICFGGQKLLSHYMTLLTLLIFSSFALWLCTGYYFFLVAIPNKVKYNEERLALFDDCYYVKIVPNCYLTTKRKSGRCLEE